MIALITGGFDPLHLGHIQMIDAARIQCGQLNLEGIAIGLNSDEWLARKKGRHFLDLDTRLGVATSIKGVIRAFSFDDSDGTANDAIAQMISAYGSVAFINGGGYDFKNLPEYETWKHDTRVTFSFNMGGNDKTNSSSDILEDWYAWRLKSG